MFYVSDDLQEVRGLDLGSQFKSRWCDAWGVDEVWGEPERCPMCGCCISSFQWKAPRKIRLTSTKYPDRIRFYLQEPLVVSQRFVDAYQKSQLNGIRDFLPIEVVKVARKLDIKAFPKYYCAKIEFTEKVRIDYSKSKLYGQSYDWSCDLCNPLGQTNDRIEKIAFKDFGNELDIFRVYGFGVVVTERFFEFVNQHHFTNFNLIPASAYRYD